MLLNGYRYEMGQVVVFAGRTHMIFAESEQTIHTIEIDCEKYNIHDFSLPVFENMVRMGEAVLSEREEVKKQGKISPEDLALAKEKQKVIEKMLQELYPNIGHLQSRGMDRCQYFDCYRKTVGCSDSTAHRHIRRYLQSGRNVDSLLEKRRERRPVSLLSRMEDREKGRLPEQKFTENEMDIVKAFEWGYRNFRSRQFETVTAAYDMMKYDFFLDDSGEWMPDIPSEMMFRRYVKKHLGGVSVKEFVNRKDYANNRRPKKGDAGTGVEAPGVCFEIDGLEPDFMIVSDKDRSRLLGKPYTHAAVDVYSHTMVGLSSDYEVNSWLSATNLFAEFMFRKEPVYNDAGEVVIPIGVIPMAIRVDQGAEFVCRAMTEFGRETQIDIHVCEGGKGSFKGIVEQAFAQFQKMLRSVGGRYGAYRFQYMKDSETGKKLACVTKTEYDRIMLDFQIYFNQHVRKNMILTREQIKAGCSAQPYRIWAYGCNNIYSPIWMNSRLQDRYFFALLYRDIAFQIDDKGISYRKLIYFQDESWFISLIRQAKRKNVKKLDIRYDPRSVRYVWLKYEETIRQIPLAPMRENLESYRDMTWKEYMEIYARYKAQVRDAAKKDADMRAELRGKTHTIMSRAKKEQAQNGAALSDENLVNDRSLAQQEHRKEHALYRLFMEDSEKIEQDEVLRVDTAKKEEDAFDFAWDMEEASGNASRSSKQQNTPRRPVKDLIVEKGWY